MVARLMEDVSLLTTRGAALVRNGSQEDLVVEKVTSEEIETLRD